MSFECLFSSDLGIHFFFNLFEMIWGEYSFDSPLNLPFFVEIGKATTARGETNASTPSEARETKTLILC